MTTTPTIPAALTTEKWISHFTLIFGVLAAIPVAISRGLPWGAGILVGSILAWLNFRWLKQGLDVLTTAPQPKPTSPNHKFPSAPTSQPRFATG